MELRDLMQYLVNAFEKLGINYFITGSIASIFYGEPRFTNDIDVVAVITEAHVAGLLKLFPEDTFCLSEDAMRTAIKNSKQFNIIYPASGLKVDVIVSKKDSFDTSRFQRIKKISPADKSFANFSSPEDVIIMKMKYYKEGASEKHLRDITSMLKISGDSIDTDYIHQWAGRLGIEEIWQAIVNKLKNQH